jgi:IclR family transcriptional regulator, pca regulon regulatory protein
MTPDTMESESTEVTSRPGDAYVQSFARGLSVIRSFDATRPAQTLSEVAAASGLTRAGARRILLTLQALGYVDADGRYFTLTAKILDLGFAYLTSMPFWNLAEPVMEELVERVHESCSAAVLNGSEIVYVLRVPTHKIMTINLSIGSRLPAFCTSMGRVLLAALDDDKLDAVLDAHPLEARTPRTIVDKPALKSALALVRKQGWAIVDQELEEGLRAVAAPIRGSADVGTAAINISAHASRVSIAALRSEILPALLETAAQIEADLQAQGTA